MGQIEQLYGRRPTEPFGGPARATGGAERNESAQDEPASREHATAG